MLCSLGKERRHQGALCGQLQRSGVEEESEDKDALKEHRAPLALCGAEGDVGWCLAGQRQGRGGRGSGVGCVCGYSQGLPPAGPSR